MDIANALSFCTVTGAKAVSYNSLRPTGYENKAIQRMSYFKRELV